LGGIDPFLGVPVPMFGYLYGYLSIYTYLRKKISLPNKNNHGNVRKRILSFCKNSLLGIELREIVTFRILSGNALRIADKFALEFSGTF
jgi:hypothetical protein